MVDRERLIESLSKSCIFSTADFTTTIVMVSLVSPCMRDKLISFYIRVEKRERGGDTARGTDVFRGDGRMEREGVD